MTKNDLLTLAKIYGVKITRVETSEPGRAVIGIKEDEGDIVRFAQAVETYRPIGTIFRIYTTTGPYLKELVEIPEGA